MSLVILGAIALVVMMLRPAYAVGGAASLSRPRDDLMESMEEWNEENGVYISEQVAPVVQSDVQKGVFSRLRKEDNFADEGTLARATDGGYVRANFGVDDSTYDCAEYGAEFALDNTQVSNLAASYGIPAEQIAAKFAYNRVRRRYESRVASKAQSTTLFTGGKGNYTDVSGSNPWATAGSKIIKTITDAVLAIATRGYVADSVAMTYKQWLNIINCDQFAGRLQYMREASFQAIADFIAPALGVRNIEVARAIKNTAAENATFSGSRIWNDSYVTVYAKGSLMVTKHWTKGVSQFLAMEEYDDPAKNSRVIRCRQTVGELMLDDLAGQLLKVE